MPYTYKYPHPAVTTDCVVLTFHDDKLKILLIRRGIDPFKGFWALPGGFMRIDESAEEGALRELREETGVTGCRLRQFHTFSAPGRDPRERVITIAFYALMRWCKAEGADDAEFADWIAVDNLPPLAFDHDRIVKLALETIRRDIFFEPVGFDLLNEVFSMSELQKVYEAILGREFDRRNFAKKMKHLALLEEAEVSQSPEPSAGDVYAEVVRNDKVTKKLPLPFLNEPLSSPKPSAPASDGFNAEAPGSLTFNDYDICCNMSSGISWESGGEENKETRPRRGLLWRLNRKKYDKLKDDLDMEF